MRHTEYTEEQIRKITTKEKASFLGFVVKARGQRVLGADGTWRWDLCRGIGQHPFETDIDPSGYLMFTPTFAKCIVTLFEIFGHQYPHVLLTSSGSKALNFAIKLAREKTGIPAKEASVITTKGTFGGKDLVAAALSGEKETPLTKNVLTIPFYSTERPNDARYALEDILKSDTQPCCFITELFQAEGGFNAAPPSYFIPLLSMCHDKKIPIIFDEMQTGCCRVGEWTLAKRMNLDMYPDMTLIGKHIPNTVLLFREGFNADRASISETNPGGDESRLKKTLKILMRFRDGGYIGPHGKVCMLEKKLETAFQNLKAEFPVIESFTILGSMASIRLKGWHNKPAAQKFVDILLDYSYATSCGRDKQFGVRFYFSADTTDRQLHSMFTCIRETIQRYMKGSTPCEYSPTP